MPSEIFESKSYYTNINGLERSGGVDKYKDRLNRLFIRKHPDLCNQVDPDKYSKYLESTGVDIGSDLVDLNSYSLAGDIGAMGKYMLISEGIRYGINGVKAGVKFAKNKIRNNKSDRFDKEGKTMNYNTNFGSATKYVIDSAGQIPNGAPLKDHYGKMNQHGKGILNEPNRKIYAEKSKWHDENLARQPNLLQKVGTAAVGGLATVGTKAASLAGVTGLSTGAAAGIGAAAIGAPVAAVGGTAYGLYKRHKHNQGLMDKAGKYLTKSEIKNLRGQRKFEMRKAKEAVKGLNKTEKKKLLKAAKNERIAKYGFSISDISFCIQEGYLD